MIASDQGQMISQFIWQNQKLFLVDELIRRDLQPQYLETEEDRMVVTDSEDERLATSRTSESRR